MDFRAYAKRPIRFLELRTIAGFQIKIYGIAYEREEPRLELVEAALRVATHILPQVGQPHHGVGFLGVHDGRDSNFVFLDYWANENELMQHLFVSAVDDPTALVPAPAGGPVGCVWDLRLLAFEREAWLEHVLRKAPAADIEGYLRAQLHDRC